MKKEDILKIDSELVEKVKKGDNASLLVLIDKYDPLIRNLTKQFYFKYWNTPLEKEDIRNILLKTFWELILKFDTEYKKSFPAFIKQYLTWGGHEQMRKLINNTHKTLNLAKLSEGTSLKTAFEYNDKTEMDLGILKEELTDDEFRVLELSANGFTIEEVATMFSKAKNYVYSVKYRALRKVRKNKEELTELL